MGSQNGYEFTHVRDVGLAAAPDPMILEWAAAHGLILLTHDRKTIPPFAYARVSAGLAMPGVFLVSDDMAIGQAIAPARVMKIMLPGRSRRTRARLPPYGL